MVTDSIAIIISLGVLFLLGFGLLATVFGAINLGLYLYEKWYGQDDDVR